ncbi:DUF1707 domain-containing protein [Mycobacterium sp. CVI_P3]|uniref:DUF1707 domain-containing protein n=1 Tax=Mycobacterium pinniadriaticum TaxID=2994102 RepID=A0ABT3SN89_9MYCO|nr:DUF1707 domain-containing protein [Mycobacterium pinniadriaticum]MCX2934192.1 DUF1707 domain-containing protein [Mycobacterium pinniadriaticum]MCX2940614.1 DUF1707 domain-containing protein [Mycobacterium pinniadriaticum]
MSTATVRVGDRDRQATADMLSQALAQGYLDLAEYETRVQAAFTAETADALRRVVADLPVEHLRRTDPQRIAARKRAARASVRFHLLGYAAMVVIVLTVWLAIALTSGAGYFWPIWPILGGAIGLLGHMIPVFFPGIPTAGFSCRNFLPPSHIRR